MAWIRISEIAPAVLASTGFEPGRRSAEWFRRGGTVAPTVSRRTQQAASPRSGAVNFACPVVEWPSNGVRVRGGQKFWLPRTGTGGIVGRDATMGARFWNRLSHERELWRKGMSVVAGVDEAGCGPLAGPVVAAAVVFPCAWLEAGLCSTLRGLNDSKQLTAEERDKFFCALTSHPEIRHAIASVDVEMIDRINIRQAAWRAMQLALDRLDPRPEHVLIDGLRIKWLPYAHTALVQGDCRSYTIAAASVLAKVSRDRMMTELDRLYPGYGFAEHKGYGTPQHYAAIRERGPCPIHRRTFAPFRPVEIELGLFGGTAGGAGGCED